MHRQPWFNVQGGVLNDSQKSDPPYHAISHPKTDTRNHLLATPTTKSFHNLRSQEVIITVLPDRDKHIPQSIWCMYTTSFEFSAPQFLGMKAQSQWLSKNVHWMIQFHFRKRERFKRNIVKSRFSVRIIIRDHLDSTPFYHSSEDLQSQKLIH
jgi:hypothetical protein